MFGLAGQEVFETARPIEAGIHFRWFTLGEAEQLVDVSGQEAGLAKTKTESEYLACRLEPWDDGNHKECS